MSDVERKIQLTLNGSQVEFPDSGDTLLGVLRDTLHLRSVKDGCSPQGQCGCCTVLVDGQPRVACVTPARRVKGRTITTIEGLPAEVQAEWGQAFCDTGGSQCGFCTPGIVVRLEALRIKGTEPEDLPSVEQALLAHMCRCTGWQTITETWKRIHSPDLLIADRDFEAAARRASIEGGAAQVVGPEVALGQGGFAADTAPKDCLVAVLDSDRQWHVGETLAEARAAAGKVQGRRTTFDPTWPIELPEGDWVSTLQTTWVEPAYLETDASWCDPGGQPVTSLANGGAFGAKVNSFTTAAASELANLHGRAVLALASREDTVHMGPKRPPVAGAMAADGTGILRVGFSGPVPAEALEAVAAVAPGLIVEAVNIPGPPTSTDLRAALWAEAYVLASGVSAQPMKSPSGATASAEVGDQGIEVTVSCGEILDETVLRSYCIGAAHMALSWVKSEGIAVDDTGEVHDLTVRSFGVLRAVDTPPIGVKIIPGEGDPVNGSDAVFAAVAAAVGQAELGQSSSPAKQAGQNSFHRWPTGVMISK